MEWKKFFDGLATEAALAPDLAAKRYAWEWRGNTFHIQSKPDNRFYMEFTLSASGYMTVTLAGYCKLVSYKIQLHPGDESDEFLQGNIIAATKMLWRVGSEAGAQQLWHAFNETFQPETLWLEPDE